MIVKQIWTANAYRNFNYLVACAETGEALAIDPLDSDKCLKAAKDEGWDITQILNQFLKKWRCDIFFRNQARSVRSFYWTHRPCN